MPRGSELLCDFASQDLRQWVERRTARWHHLHFAEVADWTEENWATYRQIRDEFGSLQPRIGEQPGAIIVQRYMQRMKAKRYSLGLHLAALRDARNQRDYGAAEEIVT